MSDSMSDRTSDRSSDRSNTQGEDGLWRFHFPELPIRGAIVHLDQTTRMALRNHQYSNAVAGALGEFLAATGLLASTIKNASTLTLQARGQSAVQVLMAECRDGDGLRAIARMNPDQPAPLGDFQDLLPKGDLAITLQPERGETYQGVVGLSNTPLTRALEQYFDQSEQLLTRLWIDAGRRHARGLLLQRLPGAETEMGEGFDADAWNRLTMLADTVSGEELKNLQPQELLRRLFHEETVRLAEPKPMQFRCTCSRERSAGALQLMAQDEVEQILAEDGEVTVDCQFCGECFRYDSVDVEDLFHAGRIDPPGRENPPALH